MKTIKAWTRIAVFSGAVLLLVACGGGGGDSSSGGGGGGGGTNVTVPNVVGMTQAAASSAITGAGLTVGTVTMANSSTVAAGDVISENPAAGASVASGSAVALTVSSGPAPPPQVAVPNVVGATQAAATTAITGAGLKVGTVTMASSKTVPSGSVISESPAAGTKVAPASAVNLTVSSGPPTPHYAYVVNQGDTTLSEFSFDPSTGALTAVASSPLAVTGASKLNEIKIDPSHKFVYVVDQGGSDQVFGYQIQADGSLMAITGSPFPTGVKPVSLVFDATGVYLFVLNQTNDSISRFSVDPSTGALTTLGSAAKITVGSNPAQLARAGSFLYVVLTNANGVDLFTINADGSLTETSDVNAPYQTDTGPFGLAVNPAATLLYTANNGPSGAGSVSSFMINGDGSLTPFCSPLPCFNALPITASSDIGIDPQGKYLFVTDQTNTGAGLVDVFPLDASTSTGLDTAVSGSPFSTGGNNPNAVSFDASGGWVFVGNSGSANFAEFSLNSAASPILSPAAASPIAAGNTPVFIAVD
jgi:6-phosphogluconolactonase (cycloisomerase 2 family)